ncbi:MAG TPA: hypothetical protein VMW38_15185, partial [Terriglobia bacterium]|nr:hypothetical protein [Terriglobia bacterium]
IESINFLKIPTGLAPIFPNRMVSAPVLNLAVPEHLVSACKTVSNYHGTVQLLSWMKCHF